MDQTLITRRTLLSSVPVGAGLLAASRLGFADAAKRASTQLHRYPDYGWLRGFSVVPSWGETIEQAWTDYDPRKFREEVALARTVHANCIRLWIEHSAWKGDPKKTTAAFLDAVAAIDEAGMKTMPCLFNRWHAPPHDYGGLYPDDLKEDFAPRFAYVRALVEPLAGDPRVLMWDLCNEPQYRRMDRAAAARELDFFTRVAQTVREAGAKQPITIGTMTVEDLEIFGPLCDVLNGHPYCLTEAELREKIAAFAKRRAELGKPLLVSECTPGGLVDSERGAITRFTLDRLSEAGMGWMGWALREGKAVATRRDRLTGPGIGGQGYHPSSKPAVNYGLGRSFCSTSPAGGHRGRRDRVTAAHHLINRYPNTLHKKAGNFSPPLSR